MKEIKPITENRRAYLILFTTVFAFVVLVNAWNCDDAYHGFVTVRNIINGDGFVYNIGERVNVCTCPLFILILTALTFVIREPGTAAFILCTAFSTGAFYIVASKLCKNIWQVIFVFFAMVSSYCFMSFTTSGLENSLIFLELACFVTVYSKNDEYGFKKLILLAFIDAMVLFTRTDVGFMLFVPTAYVFLFKKKCKIVEMFAAGIIGLIPYFMWEVFSAFYFGSWFPNPFYVKVGTSIQVCSYISHGIQYLLISFMYDAVLIVPIFVAIIALLLSKKIKSKIFGVGMMMNLFWVIYMGGDFMVGRHYTDLFFVSIAWIVIIINDCLDDCTDLDIKISRFMYLPYIILVLCTIFSIDSRAHIVKALVYPQNLYECGEERDYYYPTLGLMPRLIGFMATGEDVTDNTWPVGDDIKDAIDRGDKGVIAGWAPGVLVYKYNEKIYLIDGLALGDGFLSKLPSIYTYPDPWRVGHTIRELPAGYADSIRYGDNRLEDPDLKEYYDMYLKVTRGKLLSKERIKLAFKFAMGRYQYLIDRYVEKNNQK